MPTLNSRNKSDKEVCELMRLKPNFLELDFKGKNTTEEKFNYLLSKYKETIVQNTCSKVAENELKGYAEQLDEVVDYLLGIKDYNALCPKAQRVMMFLLSCTSVWYCNNNKLFDFEKKDVDRALKLIYADVLPEFRKQVIRNFLERNEIVIRCLSDYDKNVLDNPDINDTICMYKLGLPLFFVRNYRKRHNIISCDGEV